MSMASQRWLLWCPFYKGENRFRKVYAVCQNLCYVHGLPGGSAVKNPPAMQETQEMLDQSLGQEDPPEKSMATHSSILAWRIPWMEKPARLQSIRLQRGRHYWRNLGCKHAHSHVPMQVHIFSGLIWKLTGLSHWCGLSLSELLTRSKSSVIISKKLIFNHIFYLFAF